VSGTHPTLYRALDEVIGLTECEVFTYVPDIESDPHGSDFSDDEDDVKSVGDSDSSDDSGDEPFAFDDYDVDEAAPVHRPAFGGRLRALVDDDLHTHTVLRRRGAILWSSHWFFFNRRLKRILFVTVWARSRGMTRWGDDDDFYGSPEKLQTISGERFWGWDGAVGAGARAMGLSAAA
jgi:hypothetical protein